MFTPEMKRVIAYKVQAILQETLDKELPDGEIQFLLHVDGEGRMSWANIGNNSSRDKQVPLSLIRNMSKDA